MSILLSARNEATGLAGLLPAVCAALPDAEVIGVDDGSVDGTAGLCPQAGFLYVLDGQGW
ncbi:hypothetical protein GWK36_12690 [Caldichromatium japonicum]|uniref:Glycosyltransferase n=1 Tax=Caldichromatium japonicum TaxID=2699430 RepID=A0A6G7VFP3_9GAMM|nr:hypothetical protein [Caldichromatium japonicum]QIK38696.1 hypothetical protein GWK36_12690 [Caldichromatium japonicum]